VVPRHKGLQSNCDRWAGDGLVTIFFHIERDHLSKRMEEGFRYFTSLPSATEDEYNYIYRVHSSSLMELISGQEDIEVLASFRWRDQAWESGVVRLFIEPQRKADPELECLRAKLPWTRLVFADFNYLYFGKTLNEPGKKPGMT